MCIIVIMWAITFFFATLFQSWPISGNWQIPPSGQTMNTFAMFVAAGVLEIVTDVVTLALPMFPIWNLHIKTREKWVLSGIFLLGATYVTPFSMLREAWFETPVSDVSRSVCFASILRVYYIIHYLGPNARPDPDFTCKLGYYPKTSWTQTSQDNWAGIVIWSAVEPYVGLICACLPTLRPVFPSSKSRFSPHSQAPKISKNARSRTSGSHDAIQLGLVRTKDRQWGPETCCRLSMTRLI
jgi:hypothetical protein